MTSELLLPALNSARKGRAEGGIPIGAALYVEGAIVSTGRNRRQQLGSVIRHAEMDCLEHAGRLPAGAYTKATMVTTLSPCDMCTGAILLYRIPHVVIGENRSYRGAEDLLRERGVQVDVLDDQACTLLMQEFMAEFPSLWNEDIGVL
ncbi:MULTISPECIES: nucleoside deaminase [Arthrobacter]|uniref:Nucleoside deaminase n=1 Tax=Arthrobacter caoxuetaonis TaxID=2886935 RepID=A0A9X1MEP2_9MICC|nr:MULTISPECIES: nucleoside deaminase [Arthrobacter]MCC3282040.1 nucleoside deaminase [Arthrobacter caoxuetaonis]MCC3297577.1 nucleoside deaminase [Arthrobacter caoxuetaonis]MCC9194473.1 nucleoside deaminase [Arthrobacter sp. zg-Y916]USQ57895.1 nucleoside deaminase [Arthrobacter caoxuetaonis]